MSKSGGVFQIDDVTRAMSKGGGACECPRVGGVFQIDDVTRTMSKGGGCAWCSTHRSSDPPPTWLAGYGPDNVTSTNTGEAATIRQPEEHPGLLMAIC